MILTFKDDNQKGAVKLLNFKAGIAENVTPQKAYATIEADNLDEIKSSFEKFISTNKLEGKFDIDDKQAKIELTGQGAHASALKLDAMRQHF